MTLKKITPRFFYSLRWKLIATYTLVTALALLVLEALALIFIFAIYVFTDSYETAYLDDVRFINFPRTAVYLEQSPIDEVGLQNWVDDLYASGVASLPPQDILDSPAAYLVDNTPVYVLDTDYKVLAVAGNAEYTVGQTYAGNVSALQIMDETISDLDDIQYASSIDYRVVLDDGSYLMTIPIVDNDDVLLGFLLLNIASTPSAFVNLSWVVFVTVGITGIILIALITPFGALFGFVMSRRITKRIGVLSIAARQWAEDDFSALPVDTSQDELGALSRDLAQMAEDIQIAFETRQEIGILDERNRIARELHDTVKQHVFATMMQVRAAKNLLETKPEQAREHLNQAEELIKASQQELVLMINEMRPINMYDGGGFVDMLSEYLENWGSQTEIKTELQVKGTLDEEIGFLFGHNLFRIVQEALANVHKHSGAAAVQVEIKYMPNLISISIADDGIGFDAAAPIGDGFGLESMRHRAERIGGALSVESEKDQGTTIITTIALE